MQNLETQSEAVEYFCIFLLKNYVKDFYFLDKSIHCNADQGTGGQC